MKAIAQAVAKWCSGWAVRCAAGRSHGSQLRRGAGSHGGQPGAAAAPDKSLAFALAGTVVLVPLILGYTAYAYWVFRGKISPDTGYH